MSEKNISYLNRNFQDYRQALIDFSKKYYGDLEIDYDDASISLKEKKEVNFKDGQEVVYAGIISSIKKKFTKNNKIMAFVTVEDLYGTAEILVFENVYLSAESSLTEE